MILRLISYSRLALLIGWGDSRSVGKFQAPGGEKAFLRLIADQIEGTPLIRSTRYFVLLVFCVLSRFLLFVVQTRDGLE